MKQIREKNIFCQLLSLSGSGIILSTFGSLNIGF